MVDANTDRVYTISEAGELTGVPAYLLRQWEKRFSYLRPRRSPSGRRLYSKEDIDIIRRIKTLLKHEGMTSRGARAKLAQELHEVGRPKNTQEMRDIV
ncbi:MAG TPA: MerR family transcriptional regulator, partial [Candidatus Hydrogenedentes bacterium]|nr:MerR family transcriptional regulator [Candidatus Hydrogenedentota bacterium]